MPVPSTHRHRLVAPALIAALGGGPLFAVTDYQGSTLLLMDANQAEAARYDYTPYGTTTKTGRAASGNPFRWNGHWQIDDAHGTYLVGHRQHDPKLARFTQVDLSGQELNRYTYGMANPVTNTDPTGLISNMLLSQTLGAGGVAAIAAGLVVAGCAASLGAACPALVAGALVVGGAAGGGIGAILNGALTKTSKRASSELALPESSARSVH